MGPRRRTRLGHRPRFQCRQPPGRKPRPPTLHPHLRQLDAWHPDSNLSRPSDEFDHHASAYHCSSTLQARKCYVAFRIQQTINLRTASAQQHRHPVFGYLPFLHRLIQLPCDHFLDSFRLSLFKNAFFLHEIVDTGTEMISFPSSPAAHHSSSSFRFRANSKSWSGVLRVFLMKPCSATDDSCGDKGEHEPFALLANRSEFLIVLVPWLGTMASQRAIAIARVTNPFQWPDALLPVIPLASLGQARGRLRGERSSTGSSTAAALLAS